MTSARGPSQTERAHALGSRLRQLRRAAKLTQRQVAERVPMSAANLSRIENGEQGPPSDEVIEGLARALDVDATELLALAGRSGAVASSDTLLRELRALRTEVKDGFARVEAAIQRGR
jgi:transcriptional regulator with XRE-family HTH domain